jgi:peptide/nickel transport system permease protein
MHRIIIRRLVLLAPTVLIVTFIVYGMIRVNPDSIVGARLGEGYTPAQAQQVRHEYRLDQPLIPEYGHWLVSVLHGNWGTSTYTFKPVLTEIGPRVAVTLELALFAVAFTVIIGIPVGVFAAMRQDGWPDYTLRTFAIAGLSVPGFYIATVVMVVLASRFHWIPNVHYRTPIENPAINLSEMWLPAFILSLSASAQVMRFARAMMLDVLRQDYMRTAWAKGLRERVVIVRHAMKNAMLPVVTVLGLTLATLVGGTVVFEVLFSLPGLGTELLGSVQQRDFAVVQGIALFFGLAVVTINLLVDLSYTLLDPRARA